MAATLNAATFMGKNFSTIQSFVKNCEDLTLKQMFDVTAQLVNNQDEINGLYKIQWEKNSWKRLSLIGDETVINLESTKVYVFSDSVLCFGKVLQHPESNEAWKNRVTGIQSGKSYRDYDAINGESTEFEWNIFPGFTTLQLCDKINGLLNDLGQTPETFTGRIVFMSMFNDIPCDRKGNIDECFANAGVVKVLARRFGVGQWSFIGPGSEKKWYSAENSPQGAWDKIAEKMLLEFAESGHPTFRATTPLSRGQLKSKGRGKLSIHFAADDFTIDTIFRIILSVNQLSVHGAVAASCEEFESHQDGSGEPEILMGQSINCARRSQSRSSFAERRLHESSNFMATIDAFRMLRVLKQSKAIITARFSCALKNLTSRDRRVYQASRQHGGHDASVFSLGSSNNLM